MLVALGLAMVLQMERMRRKAVRDHKAAIAAGGTHPFDPNRPWAHVWEVAPEQWDTSWKEEVEDSGVQALAQAGAIQRSLGIDAPFAAASQGAG